MGEERELVFGVLVGSLRKGSYNGALARALEGHVPAGTRLVRLPEIGAIPLFNEDVQNEGIPEPVQALHDAIVEVDAVVIAAPEYNYSVPGVLKNALDWLSRTRPQPFAGKPTAIMSASPGAYGGVRGQHHLRQVLVALNAVTLPRPEVIVANAKSRFDDEGRLTDERTHEFLGKLLEALAETTRRFG